MPSKPGRWAVSPAHIDPQYLNLWHRLVALVPFWDGSGTPSEVVFHTLPTYNGLGVWQADNPGWSLEFDAGTDSPVELDTTRIDFQGTDAGFDEGFAIWVMFRYEGASNIRRTLFSSSLNSGGGNWQVHVSHNNDGKIRCGYSGEANLDTPSAINNDRTLYQVVYTWDGTDLRLYLDGVLVAGPTAASQTTADPANRKVQIGDFNASAAFLEWDGAILATGVWNRGLSAAEAQQLYRDPFGLVRPAPISIEEVVSGAGAITEQTDDATGAGAVLVSGSGAITEQPDNATGLGTSGAVAVLIAAVSVVGRPRVSVISRRRIKVTDRNRVT